VIAIATPVHRGRRTQVWQTRLETDDSGRTVTGVVVSRNGGREVYRYDYASRSGVFANP